jgi:hypothetical protein
MKNKRSLFLLSAVVLTFSVMMAGCVTSARFPSDSGNQTKFEGTWMVGQVYITFKGTTFEKGMGYPGFFTPQVRGIFDYTDTGINLKATDTAKMGGNWQRAPSMGVNWAQLGIGKATYTLNGDNLTIDVGTFLGGAGKLEYKKQ